MQKFGIGDVVKDENFIMVIREVIQDDDGTFFYECEPIGFVAPFAREIPQYRLEPYK